MTNLEIINALTIIESTYKTMRAFFYQKVIQNTYVNNQLKVYLIDYSLLLPGSQFINDLNTAQVNAQIQYYINLCNTLVLGITTTINLQQDLFYERIQVTLNDSISQINGFGIALIKAKYLTIFNYIVEYDMSFSEALYNNNISLDQYALNASLNYNIQDFNNLRQNQIIKLNKSL